MSEKNNITLELSQEEALVLLSWLSKFNEKEIPELFEDQAEERVLWDLEAMLEKQVESIFNSDYDKILANARALVRDTE